MIENIFTTYPGTNEFGPPEDVVPPNTLPIETNKSSLEPTLNSVPSVPSESVEGKSPVSDILISTSEVE